MADVGEPLRKVDIVPIPSPAEAPVIEPSPEPVKEPQPA